ncbi:MAG TPA: single-stranded-DNA-specific exonuclease RecJ [bacterium]|nr:single-stranded-DNA-specific exonuclease RecJ [bacterium]HQL61151.1 single-stranded-DNA-specific exonuclease RecJ [bacterium]
MTRAWKIRPHDSDRADCLAADLSISPLIARLLVQRGITETEDARTFLNPSQDVFHSPFLFNGMEQAVERIARAREQNERVLIHGDYDVDGITGTAILLETLWELGLDVEYYLPHRIEEGYGVSIDRIAEFAGQFQLMITVDCGTTSTEEIALAREKGMDVIVTDHHRPGKAIPAAIAVLNPILEEEEYPFRDLAGAGVAYKLACALRETLLEMPSPEEMGLDLATLGTVSDVVSLLDENRTLVSRGIPLLREAVRPGIRALLDVSSTDPKRLDTHQIAFRIGPRINALGRLSDPRSAVELLVTRDEVRAFEIATEMHRLNAKRQALEKQVSSDAQNRMIQAGLLNRNLPLLIIDGEKWHRGVLGIVASHLAAQYGVPVILMSQEDGILHGSGRSLPSMDLGSVLEDARPLLLSGGGHENAVGLSVDVSKYEELCETLIRGAQKRWGGQPEPPPLWLDAELPLEQVDDRLIEDLAALAPFGQGNPSPVFLFRGEASTYGGRIVGNNHLRLTLAHSRGRIEAIGYGMGERLSQLRLDRLQIAGSPYFDEYRDVRSIQLRMVDVRSDRDDPVQVKTEPNKPETTMRLDRERLGKIFRLIQKLEHDGFLSRVLLNEKAGELGIRKEEIYLAVVIFVELQLARTRGDRIELIPSKEKRDLSQSATFRRLNAT